jgi:hypothetical protein
LSSYNVIKLECEEYRASKSGMMNNIEFFFFFSKTALACHKFDSDRKPNIYIMSQSVNAVDALLLKLRVTWSIDLICCIIML